ncbi:MAG: SDR family oxidoreductase [Bacteroidia bacterium]|nr:SDR family oxidoreductase [Bacteroidia bacterium]
MNSTAIVTGAASGIGKAIAWQLMHEGFFVVLADRDEEKGQVLQKEWDRHGCCFQKCDITSEKDVHELIRAAQLQHDKIDVLVNNAGLLRDQVIWKMSTEDFDRVIDVNLKGTWLMCKAVAPVMKEQRQGRIINIASRAWLGNAGQSNYAASKAGVIALTRVLALELGKYNVLVNAVAPGLIDTPLTRKLEPAVLQKLMDAQPTGQMGRAEDVARLVSFLAAAETQFITGQTIYVDGGKSIGAGI